MKEYSEYTIEIVLQSPIITPFQSDTLFGHLCWAISFLQWEEKHKLENFLAGYDTGFPPLLISNGFFKGYLPKPLLPPVTQNEIENVIGKENRIDNSFRLKSIKNIDIMPKDEFIKLQADKITPFKLFEVLWENYETILNASKYVKSIAVQHNTINRIEGRVTRGLYSQEEYFHESRGRHFDIYLKTNYFCREDLQKIFDFIKDQGYGRDKSTGKGHFDFKIQEGIDIPESESPNAFMTLSSYIPGEHDPTEGYYHILLKYGKLGGLYAKGILKRNPFKKPLTMFSAGSTFLDSDYKPGKNYGSLLRNVHHDNRIRHYAYAFPLGITI